MIEETLKPLATHCPQGFDIHNVRDLDERGNNIFLKDEPDPVHAAQFLTLLLCCLKSWAEKFPCDENGQRSTFQDAYLWLKGEGYVFPKMAPQSNNNSQVLSKNMKAPKHKNKNVAEEEKMPAA